MRLNWRIPLPGPFSVGGSVGGRSRGGGGGGCIAGCFKLIAYLLIFEVWAGWWMFKVFYILGVLIHRKATGRNTRIWRSRNGMW